MKCYICNNNNCDQIVSEKYKLAKHSDCNGLKKCFVCGKEIRLTTVEIKGVKATLPKDTEQIYSGVYNHIACGPGTWAWKRFKKSSINESYQEQVVSRRTANST